MNTVTTEQLYRKIQVEDFKTAIVYSGAMRSVRAGMHYFERYDCESVEDLEQNVKEFNGIYSGIFTFLLKKTSGGIITSGCLCTVNLTPQPTAASTTTQAVQQRETEEEMRARLLATIKTEYELSMMRATIEQQKAQIMETSTTSGRMALMFENFVMAKMGGKAPMFQPGAQLQGTVEVNNDNTEISDKDFGDALIKIKDKFGVDNLMEIAKKIDANDPNIDMLINMLK